MDTIKALESARCAEVNIETVEKMMPVLKIHPHFQIAKAQIKDVIEELEEKDSRESHVFKAWDIELLRQKKE